MRNVVRSLIKKYKSPLRLFVLFLSVYVFSSNLQAQHTPLYFRHLTVEDGLSSNSINCIIQDSVGFMWFGSDAGLERFDGYEFKTIQVEDTLKGRLVVSSILEDWDEARFFWLGTNRGVKKYYPSMDKIVSEDIAILNKKSVKKIIKDHLGILWFDGANSLVCYNPETKGVKIFKKMINGRDSLSINIVVDIFEDSQNNLFLGTNKGLAIYNRSEERFVQIRPEISIKRRKISKYNAIREDKNGALWIGSVREGLIKYDVKTGIFEDFSRGLHPLSYSIKDVLIDTNGFIWLVSDAGGGLTKFDPKTATYENYRYTNASPNSLSENFLNCIYQDRQGVIWIGTRKNGIERFQGNATLFINLQNELLGNSGSFTESIFSFVEDKPATIWTTSKRYGLLQINFRTREIKRYTYLPLSAKNLKNRITTIHKINAHFFVLGSLYNGILSFDPVSGRFSPLLKKIPELKRSLSVFTGIKDRNGILWFGLIEGGILRFNPQTQTYKLYATSNDKKIHNRVLHLFENEKGDLYAGIQSSKVLKYNPVRDIFEIYYRFEEKEHISVQDLYEDTKNRLWMATNHGLFMLNIKTDSLAHFTYKQGISGEKLLCVLPDNDGNLWLSYNSGLIYFDPEVQKGQSFSYKDGIASISFRQNSSYKTKDGTLLFGGKDGFTMFKPDSNLHARSPAIMISKSEIYVNDANRNTKGLFKQNFARNKSLQLPYNNYGFLFEFALTDFISPFRSHYKYMLERGTGQWQDLGSRHSISFVSLPPGKYKLRIKGQNSQGLWSINEAVAEFEILPPFWQTWWFQIWGLLTILLLIFSGYRLRVFSIRRRNAELETINKKLNDQIHIRRQIEHMLTENEIKYRTLVEGIGDGIYTLNATGIFHFMNKTAAARIGGKPADFSGHSIYEYFPEDIVKPLMARVKKVIQDGVSREIETEIEIMGSKKNYSVSIHPLKNEHGETTLTLHIAVDTSEKVKLEDQLRQAQKMEAIGNLAGGIAHDFNNLLSVIRGYSFLLLAEENLDETIYKSIKEIDSAGERAQGLTRQLLAFSRKQMLKPIVMNLNTRINATKTMLGRLIPENIELKYELAVGLDHIFADPGQMDQILLNLLVNARDAMPLGGHLVVKTENVKLPEKLKMIDEGIRDSIFISLSVSDTGIGMTKEVQQKIFDPFFTTKETGRGTGLGLSTVFGIVKQSGGYIWVESAYKKGSTFFVYLPAVDQNVITEETENTVQEYPHGHQTILIVEDEASVRKMIVKMLKLYGYTTLEAKDGWDALSVYEENRESIDLVLSDVVMPGLNGVELMKKIYAINPQQKALYMSGYTDENIVRSGMIKRDIRFLQKPFSPEALMRTLSQLFSVNSPA